jgi:hypothetical protein
MAAQARLRDYIVENSSAAGLGVIQRRQIDVPDVGLIRTEDYTWDKLHTMYMRLRESGEHEDVAAQLLAALENGEYKNKSYLYLGSGNFSVPSAKARKHTLDRFAEQQDLRLAPGIRIVATELAYRSEPFGRDMETGVTPNIWDIMNRGGKVIEGFDATDFDWDIGTFDRIIFRNPHTGVYGSSYDTSGSKDMDAITSNWKLLKDTFNQARNHLNPGGELQIHICGWPYKSRSESGFGKPTHLRLKGMQLDVRKKANEFAESLRWVFLGYKDKGRQWVRRNNGEMFPANVLKLRFTPRV